MNRVFLFVSILFLSANGNQIFVDWNSPITNSTCGSSIDYACQTVQNALKNAQNGDVISLSEGTYSGSGNTQLTVPSGLTQFTISPISLDVPATIDFQNASMSAAFLSIWNSSSVTVQSIDFINARSTSHIFGVYNSTLLITDCEFINNTVNSVIEANGMYVDLTIESSLFENTLGGTGAAINIQRNAKLTLQNVAFQSNYASTSGGAIYASFVNITANNVWATGNSAEILGGFLYASDSRSAFTNSRISSHFSDGSAGAVYLHSGAFSASNVQFVNNTSEGFGGAIHTDAASIQIINSEFSQNVALLGGGAIYEAASAGTVFQCTFNKNWASKGGAIGLFSSSRLMVNSSQINENDAEYGGAVYLYSDSKFSMENSTIIENNAVTYGGGIYCSDSTVSLTSSSLAQNTATLDDNTETGSSEDLFCSSSPSYTQCTVVGDAPWAGQCQQGNHDNANGSNTSKGIMITAILLPILGGVVCCGCVAVMFIQHRKGNKAPGQWIWKKLDSEGGKDEDELPLGEDF